MNPFRYVTFYDRLGESTGDRAECSGQTDEDLLSLLLGIRFQQ